MNHLDFSFEQSAWDRYFAQLHEDHISAVQLLALLEGESEEALENAFLDLEEGAVTLDISELPKIAGTGETAVRLRQEQQLVQKGLQLANLEPNDPLRLYLEELAATPVCGDIHLLAMELRQAHLKNTQDEAVQAALVNLSLSRVVELAAEYTGRGVLLLDLIQEGSLGLWQGTLNFTGEDFERSRDWWIRQYMAKAVVVQARASGVGQKMRQAAEDYRIVDERLLSELGRNPTLEEIAEQMHMSVSEVEAVEKLLESAKIISQAHGVRESEQAVQEDNQAVEDTAYFQSRQRVHEMLSGLRPEEAELLTLRFGLEGGKPLTPEEAGRKLGLTPQEVVTREAAALAELRK